MNFSILILIYGAFHAPQTTTNRAAKSWLPVGITAYGGMHLVRRAHPTALTAERHHRVINSLVRFYLRLPWGQSGAPFLIIDNADNVWFALLKRRESQE
jgi:hypothetical protein